MSGDDKGFWSKLGSSTASGLKTAGAQTLMGSVWLARQVTKGACQVGKASQATGQAFKDEWLRQETPEEKPVIHVDYSDVIALERQLRKEREGKPVMDEEATKRLDELAEKHLAGEIEWGSKEYEEMMDLLMLCKYDENEGQLSEEAAEVFKKFPIK